MAVQTGLSVEEFERIASLPENAYRLLEYIGGEVVEVPSNPYSSEIASVINFFFRLHLREKGVAGHVTGEGGGYMVSGERYAPDVAYISTRRQAELVREGYNPNPPELAVEVFSPSDSQKTLLTKVANYLAAGTLVWVVYPKDKQVGVYRPGQPAKIVDVQGTLDGGDVLPGFSLKVQDLFASPD